MLNIATGGSKEGGKRVVLERFPKRTRERRLSSDWITRRLEMAGGKYQPALKKHKKKEKKKEREKKKQEQLKQVKQKTKPN